jgi:hypothetical protein
MHLKNPLQKMSFTIFSPSLILTRREYVNKIILTRKELIAVKKVAAISKYVTAGPIDAVLNLDPTKVFSLLDIVKIACDYSLYERESNVS